MRRIFQRRLQLQLLLALLAAAFVGALTIVLITEALHTAEGFVLSDTSKNLRNAMAELTRQGKSSTAADGAWSALPPAAQDVSLRAISETILGAYPGIEGGFWSNSHFLGYSFPTHDGGSPKIDVPESERAVIQDVIARSRLNRFSERVLRGRHDLIVIAAESSSFGSVWAMKRLPGEAEQSRKSRNLLLGSLVTAAFLSAAGVLATGMALHRGVSEIKAGLAKLHGNIDHELPARRDELGEISSAINDMARTRRRLEMEIRREDRLRATGRLVARVAHEMRNPLNSIRLSLQMLAHRLSANKLKGEDFQIAIDEVDRLNRLLSDLLAFQQPGPPDLVAKPLGPIVEHCLELLGPRLNNCLVSAFLESSLNAGSRVMVDERYAVQVIINLLLNAIEVSAPGGSITIRMVRSEQGSEVHVCDEGPGLDAEQQEHLFEPFYTTKSDGHGLGLAVSRELAHSMGGDLVYQAISGHGAVFVLKLKGGSNASS